MSAMFKCKLRQEPVADAMLLEANDAAHAAHIYADLARTAEANKYGGWGLKRHYEVAVAVPGERPKLFEVVYPAPYVTVTELKT